MVGHLPLDSVTVLTSRSTLFRTLHSVGGFGFGLISGIVSFANVVEAASGPGIVGILGGGDSQYFVLASGNELTHSFPHTSIIIPLICWSLLTICSYFR